MPAIAYKKPNGAAMRNAAGAAVTRDAGCACCGGGTGVGPNCSCGCTSCAPGGVQDCMGNKLWPVSLAATIAAIDLTYDFEFFWEASSGAPANSAAFFAANTGKLRKSGSFSISGSLSQAAIYDATCGLSRKGYYVKHVAMNGDTYVFDAMGDLPRIAGSATITSTHDPASSPSLTTADVGVYSGAESCLTELSVFNDGNFGVSFDYVVDNRAWLKISRASPLAPYWTYSRSGAAQNPQPTGEASVNAPNVGIVIAASAAPTTTGNTCDGPISAVSTPTGTAVSGSISSTLTSATYIYSQAGGRHSYEPAISLTNRPHVVAKLSGTTETAAASASAIGCSSCSRAYHVVLTKSADGTVLIDDTFVQQCATGAGIAWAYDCVWSGATTGLVMRRLGLELWTVGGYYAKGGDCPSSITEVEAKYGETESGASNVFEYPNPTALAMEFYDLVITDGLVPNEMCCGCDPDAPCMDCNFTCNDEGDDELLMTWYKTGDEPGTGIETTLYRTDTSPCAYADSPGDNRIQYDPYDGTHQSRWLVRVFDDEDTGNYYLYAKECGDGVRGFYLPIDGGPGNVEIA